MSEQNVFSLVMCHVAVSQDDEFILAGLQNRYSDVLRVERIYDEEDVDVITTRVQVDFLWGDQVATILQDRQIIFNGAARRIYPLSKVPRQFWSKAAVANRPTASVIPVIPATPMYEQDVLNLLEREKR